MAGAWLMASTLARVAAGSEAPRLPDHTQFDQPPHSYWDRSPNDRISRLKADLESGKTELDSSSEKAWVESLLRVLEIPASSQMLVFSTTSLQLSLISPSNPRALYFNADTYLGYIPRGRIEAFAIDPELGPIFYIFPIPTAGAAPVLDRSRRCMNCHAGADTAFVPGVVIRSVIPMPTGGTLKSFRQEITGHAIPLEDRFGGWHVTDGRNRAFTNHWGNLLGRMRDGVLEKTWLTPGDKFDYNRYPAATSDVLPQLVHEHQAGFVNRAADAIYRTRTYLQVSKATMTPEQLAETAKRAREFVRYILFADEAPLPSGGIEGDPAFRQAFRSADPGSPQKPSLRDFDLRSRIFKYRCSFMIETELFEKLPEPFKTIMLRRLADALDENRPSADGFHLEVSERRIIRDIIRPRVPGIELN